MYICVYICIYIYIYIYICVYTHVILAQEAAEEGGRGGGQGDRSRRQQTPPRGGIIHRIYVCTHMISYGMIYTHVVYIYIHIYTHDNMYIYIYIYIYIYLSLYIYIYIYTYLCTTLEVFIGNVMSLWLQSSYLALQFETCGPKARAKIIFSMAISAIQATLLLDSSN